MTSSEQILLKALYLRTLLGIVIFLLCLSVSSVLQAEDPFLTRESGNIKDNKKEKPEISESKGRRFPGYAAFREPLVEYCKRFIADGHHKRLQEILDRLLHERADCSSCRQLYKAMSCRVSTKQAAIEIKPVSAPSTELLALISAIFSEIASNPDLAVPTAEAITPVLAELATSKDVISFQYFEIFSAFIKAPLSKELEGAGKTEEKQKKKVKAKKLEGLF